MELGTIVALTSGQRRPVASPVPPPSAFGLLADLFVTQGVPIPTVDLSVDFTGAGLTYSLAPGSAALPDGVTLSASGILSGTPDVSTPSPLAIIVRGMNAGGSADSAFALNVEAMLLDFSADLTGLTDNPAHGPSAQDGSSLIAVAGGFTGAPPAALAYQWSTLEGGAIPGATGETFVPDASALDGQSLYCTVTAAPYPAKDTPTATVRYAPPSTAGSLVDEILDLGSGVFTLDASPVFSGAGLVFSVTGPGCAIDPQSGILTIATDAPVAGAIVTVAASNSGGQATAAFQLTIEEMGGGPGPELSLPLLDEATDSISFTVSEDCTIYWRRDPLGTNPDAAQVIAGGGMDSGSFPVVAGQNDVDIAFAPGNDGAQSLSLVAAVLASEPSLVRTVTIDIDAAPPVLVSSAPAAGATGVAEDVAPSLVFDEEIEAGQGLATLWNVTAGAVEQTFDVATDLGTALGQVEIAGTALTLRPTRTLGTGVEFSVLLDPGAIRDVAGNPHPGITDPGALSFTVSAPAVVETGFDAGFTTAYPAVWASMQANAFNAAVLHRPSQAWAGYSPATSPGGIIGDKTGPYAQLRFAVPVVAGRSYVVDADFPIGESHDGAGFSGVLRVKLGSAINLSEFLLADFAVAGQPRVEAMRGVTFQATTAQVWFAVISETNQSGTAGGDPAISMLRIREV